MDAIIDVKGLWKTFRVPVRKEGLRASVLSLVRRDYYDVPAVREISFSIRQGEVVGFLGPNGAGKTTTLKMLSGLLHPSGGEAQVAGFIPWERKPAFLRTISMVLGNKSQMLWDIPPLDTFRVLGEIYHLSSADYRRTLDELISLLDLDEILHKPVRNLSLGERMKCELAAGLLHKPQVLFLDEPTLGLDVSMQKRLRDFLGVYAARNDATILLTSHYMADVVALCRRVILIHEGRLLYDGRLEALADALDPYQVVRVAFMDGTVLENTLPSFVSSEQIIRQEPGSVSLRLHRTEVPSMLSSLLQKIPITDIAVEDAPIETVLDRVYQEGLL